MKIYTHELGNEGVRELQIARGIINREETIPPARLEIQPKYCPICHECNKQNADFCFKCNWILSANGMHEVRQKDELALKEAEQQRKEFEEKKAEQAEIKNLLQMLHESKIKERNWHKEEMQMMKDMMKQDEMLREKRKRD